MFKSRWFVRCMCALALMVPTASFAQDYPNRQITLVVGFAAGGFADAFARIISGRMSERLGQSVVIENRSGGGGNIAAASVSKAAPDGYTVLVTTNGLAINDTLTKNKGFAIDDLKIVAIPVWAPETLSVNKSNPAKTLAEFIQAAKTKPITFGSPGVGTSGHIATTYFFKSLVGIEPTHIPFQGGAPALNAIMGGHIDALTGALPGYTGQFQSGVIRGLALASDRRVPGFQDIPTYAEAGYPGFLPTIWVGVFVPSKTSDAIAEKLNATIAEIINEPGVQGRLASQYIQTRRADRATSAAYLKSEIEGWAKMITMSGVERN